jgi:hypothetical protein
MQICPHCAKPIEDFVHTCDHCGHVVLENSIDEALRALDLKLAVSMDLAQPPPMPDAPSTATLQPSNSEDWSQWADAPVAAQPRDSETWAQTADPTGLAGLLEPVARTCGSPSKAKAVSARSGG